MTRSAKISPCLRKQIGCYRQLFIETTEECVEGGGRIINRHQEGGQSKVSPNNDLLCATMKDAGSMKTS